MLGIQIDIAQYFSSKWPPPLFRKRRKQKPPNHQESTIWPVWWLTTQFCPQILKNVSITSIPPEPLISGVVCHARDQSIARPAWPNPETYYLGIRNAVGGQWSKKTQTTKVKQWLEQEKAKSMAQKWKCLPTTLAVHASFIYFRNRLNKWSQKM